MTIAASPKQERKSYAAPIALGAGAIAGTAGMIDLRPKQKITNKYLGRTLREAKRHLKPGDVVIGASQTGPSIIAHAKKEYKKYTEDMNNILSRKEPEHYSKSGYKDVLNTGKKLPKSLRKHVAAMRLGLQDEIFQPISLASKFMADPIHSHGEYIVQPTKWTYAGGRLGDPSKDETISRDMVQARKMKARTGNENHFIVFRHKNSSKDVLRDVMKTRTTPQTMSYMRRKIGRYDVHQGLTAVIKDALMPKLNKKERAYSPAELLKNQRCKGGVCSTIPALMSKETVGGKAALDVLPQDFLRSSGFKQVGIIGKKAHVNLGTKLIYSLPKIGIRVGAALGAGAATYGLSSGAEYLLHNHKKKDLIKKSAYEYGFKNEMNNR